MKIGRLIITGSVLALTISCISTPRITDDKVKSTIKNFFNSKEVNTTKNTNDYITDTFKITELGLRVSEQEFSSFIADISKGTEPLERKWSLSDHTIYLDQASAFCTYVNKGYFKSIKAGDTITQFLKWNESVYLKLGKDGNIRLEHLQSELTDELRLNHSDFESIEKNAVFRKKISDNLPGNFISLSSGYTYYEEVNKDAKGPILVFVHGFSVPSYIWESTFRAAEEKGFHCIRLDLYGRGYSDNPGGAYTDERSANQVWELLDRLMVEKAVLIGLSNGGRTINKMAATYPQRVEKMIHVASSGFRELTPMELTSVSQKEKEVFIANYPEMAKGQMGDFHDPSRFKGWDQKYASLFIYKGFAEALISTRKHQYSMDQEISIIVENKIPVVTVWGASDNVVVFDEFSSRLDSLIPERKEFTINNAGHLIHMDQPQPFEKIFFSQVVN